MAITPPSRCATVGRTVSLFVLFMAVTACGPVRTGSLTITGATMGTTFTVTVVRDASNSLRSDDARQLIEAELERVDHAMSHYRPDSELSRFNDLRHTEPFAVSPETFEVLRQAQDLGALTDGAFDITVGPLVDAWGFGAQGPTDPPSDAEIRDLMRGLGYGNLDLDPEALTVRKRDPRVACDLSAIAKGYAVDRVADALEARGVTRFMIEVGGEVRTSGLNETGVAWRIGIERPERGQPAIHRVIPLSDLAMATSGDYRNYYELDGRRISHTIDPRTGYPVTHNLASVTVIDKSCARADGLATALAVLGPEEGYRFAAAHDVAALLLVRTDEEGLVERVTPALERLLD